MQQPLPFPPAFSDHILFYISIFLLSFMPSGSSVLRRYCSTGSFHRFPYVYLPQGFFLDFFVNSLKCNVCPAFSPHFSSTALSYSATLSPASQSSAQIIRTGRADLIRIHMKPYFLSLQKNLQHLGHMCSKTVTVAFPLKIRQAHTMMRAQRNDYFLCALIRSICRSTAFYLAYLRTFPDKT